MNGTGARYLATALSLVACRSSLAPAPPDLDCGADVRDGPRLDALDSTAKKTTLVFDHRHLIGRPEERRACVSARLGEVDVRLEPFGNMSSQVCVFPKLIVHAAGERFVLVTHCNEREAVGTHLPTGIQVHGHELAYRLPSLLDLPFLRTRALSISYVDGPTQTAVEDRPAFFLEYLDDMLVRREVQRVERELPGRVALDQNALARFVLFEILIDNRDWRILDLTTVEAPMFGIRNVKGTHNVFLVEDAKGIRPVPYDLELSGFVGIPAGIRLLVGGTDQAMLARIADPKFLEGEPWLVRWAAVRLLHFRRRLDPAAQNTAAELFISRRPAIERAIAEAEVPDYNKERATQHVDAFYRALPLALQHPVTTKPIDVPSCKAVPVGTPYTILEEADDRVRVKLLQIVRLSGPDAAPMCNGSTEGWVDSASM